MSRETLAAATRAAPSGKPVSAEMIAKIEQGRKGPSLNSLQSLAYGLGIPVSDLSERAHAWQAASAAGVAASALRAATVGGMLTGAVTSALLPGPVAAGAAAMAGSAALKNRRNRHRLETLLRDKLGELPDEDIARLADQLGIDAAG